MSHLQALISRTIVHIVLQFYVLQFFVLVELSPGFVMQKGIPIAVVRLRLKTVKQYVQQFLKLMPEDDS